MRKVVSASLLHNIQLDSEFISSAPSTICTP
eukprot:COSAG02_NODE_3264_length_7066_cov_91.385101_1_plen_31_part_00